MASETVSTGWRLYSSRTLVVVILRGTTGGGEAAQGGSTPCRGAALGGWQDAGGEAAKRPFSLAPSYHYRGKER